MTSTSPQPSPPAVIDFIAADISRPPIRPLLRLATAAALAVLAAGLALGLRDDYAELASWSYLAPAAAMLLPLGVAVWLLLSPHRDQPIGPWLTACTAVVLLATFVHPASSVALRYPTRAVFWLETARCFGKGLLTSVAIAALLSSLWLPWSPLPTRTQRYASGLIASLFGIFMLNLHCSSPDARHIVLGHWGQALPLVTATMLAQRWWIDQRTKHLRKSNG